MVKRKKATAQPAKVVAPAATAPVTAASSESVAAPAPIVEPEAPAAAPISAPAFAPPPAEPVAPVPVVKVAVPNPELKGQPDMKPNRVARRLSKPTVQQELIQMMARTDNQPSTRPVAHAAAHADNAAKVDQ